MFGSLREGGGSLFVIIVDAKDDDMELYGGWDIEGSVELWIFGMEICSVLGLRCA